MPVWNTDLPKAECYELGDERLDGLVRAVRDAKEVALDTETTGLNITSSIPLFWSLSFGHRRIVMPSATMPLFRDAFEDAGKRWVMHNAKFDTHMLANVGIRIRGDLADTAVMHALLYEETPHGLKDVSKQILGWGWAGFKETFGKFHESETGRVLLETWKTDRQKVVEYAGNDAYGTFQLYLKLRERLRAEKIWSLFPEDYPTMWELYEKTELPFTKVLWKCERYGMRIDTEYFNSIERPVVEELGLLEREICRLAGRIINPKSSDQVRDLCLKDLGLKPKRFTKGGKSGIKKPSTDADFLEDHSDIPIIGAILRYRDLDKLLGTYIKGLKSKLDHEGRIHTRFNQDVARTGRLSSSDPNMQNIPNPDNDKFGIRGGFCCAPGNALIVADYSALEMRLLAAASMEKDMIQIFLDGKDIHMGNASLVFGFPYEDIVKAKKLDKYIKGEEEKVKKGADPSELHRLKAEMEGYFHECLQARGWAKAIGFGLNYGMKENKLARSIGKSKEEALDLMEKYKGRYPAVSKFYAEAIDTCRKTLKSYTILGRRRHLPEIMSDNDMDRWGAERKAVNNEIQGGAADVVRMAMINIDRLNLEDDFACHMLLQVHDELVFELPEECVEECMPIIKEAMEHPFKIDLAVPLEASIGTGSNWKDAK